MGNVACFLAEAWTKIGISLERSLCDELKNMTQSHMFSLAHAQHCHPWSLDSISPLRTRPLFEHKTVRVARMCNGLSIILKIDQSHLPIFYRALRRMCEYVLFGSSANLRLVSFQHFPHMMRMSLYRTMAYTKERSNIFIDHAGSSNRNNFVFMVEKREERG